MCKNWFQRKNTRELQTIHERLTTIEQTVHTITEQGFKNNIHIDTLHVHNPVLEKLEFRLEQLEIDEVSGALNLGNNFGVRVNPKLHAKRKSTDDSVKDSQNDPEALDSNAEAGNGTTMSNTQNGFTFRFS